VKAYNSKLKGDNEKGLTKQITNGKILIKMKEVFQMGKIRVKVFRFVNSSNMCYIATSTGCFCVNE